MKPCMNPGCSRLVYYPSNYCSDHKPQRLPDTRRPNSYQRGYTKEWQRYRVTYLANHPLCVICLQHGEMTEATVVDHIVPHKGDKQLFWDKNNHEALCKRCHDIKTATTDGGFGRACKTV